MLGFVLPSPREGECFTQFYSTLFHWTLFYFFKRAANSSLVSGSYSQPLGSRRARGRRDAMVLSRHHLSRAKATISPLKSISHSFKKYFFLCMLHSHSPFCPADNNLDMFSIYIFVCMFLENALLCLCIFNLCRFMDCVIYTLCNMCHSTSIPGKIHLCYAICTSDLALPSGAHYGVYQPHLTCRFSSQ